MNNLQRFVRLASLVFFCGLGAAGLHGANFTTLWSFTNGSDGAYPMAGLIQGSDGRLYGEAPNGGANGNGALFAINTDGSDFTTLWSFTNAINGAAPQGKLIQGADGRLYGAATFGGVHNDGTLFAINTDGSGFTLLWSFAGGSAGAYPYAGLIQGADG